MIDLSDGVPGVNGPEPMNFEEFWPYYLSQHLHPKTRAVHVAGTTAAWLVGGLGILRRKPSWIMFAPLLAYGPAFASHFIFEKNKPATLTGHAYWSFLADHRMWKEVVTGKINEDVRAIRDAVGMQPHQITLHDMEMDDSGEPVTRVIGEAQERASTQP